LAAGAALPPVLLTFALADAPIESWIVPPDPNPSLLLITQGGMFMEDRPVGGSGCPSNVPEGDLLLRGGTSLVWEVRYTLPSGLRPSDA
jgi:hypothetical protein